VLDLDWKPPTLETGRLVLRPLVVADAGDVFLFCSNPRMTLYTLWRTHETIDDSIVFLNDYRLARYANRVPDPLGVVLKADPTHSVIGTIGCFWASQADGVMELGYNLAEPYWGRGIIVDAASALLEHVFREYQVERIQARVLGGNAASARVAQKLGMNFEGTLRSALVVRESRVDVEYYALLRAQWQALSR
jgi:[ribosomal protein S5]-alanine N-acetyltransferase